ncbi:MAG TPA: zf-HC2 domain-containing protein [Mycobacteriales bacterium]|nr:zf-HC2 domain-containing protein [Mycobacteriales bacterium]
MTLPDLHLAEDALVGYVDGMLSSAADERASRHLRACAECRAAVDAEREAKALLGATPDPCLPAGLLAKLLDVPMTADIGSTDRILAFDGDSLGWSSSSFPDRTAPRRSFPGRTAPRRSFPGRSAREPRVMERRATAPARSGASVRPGGTSRPAGRSARSRRTRRGLAVSLAGLAFGVIASAASGGTSGAAAPSRPGDGPGTTRLVVGSTTPMDVSRPFLFRRPDSKTLTPAATPAP